MDYQKIYHNIISKSNPQDEYVEKHHIVPRCLGGTNNKNNLVSLSYREHFICHWLLCKIHPSNHKLKAAFGKMLEVTKNKQRIVSSKHFDAVKRQLRGVRYQWLADHMTQHGPWNKGKKGTQVAWNKGMLMGPRNEDANKKTSTTLKEKYSKQEHHLKGAEPWNKGKKGLQAAWNKGITPEKLPCPHCNLLVSKTNMKRWHGDNCKNNAVVTEP